MPYEHRVFPEFSWSHSRRDVFRECPRRYYFRYYASHNGWYDDAPEDVRLAYRLKNLTGLALEIGAAVHEGASTAIQKARIGDEVPTADELLSMSRNRLNKAWVESKDVPAWRRSPRWRRMFREVYYDTGIGENQYAETREQLKTCFENLLASTSFREAVEAPRVEIRNNEEFITFEIDETKIHAVPDLIYRRGDGTWTIVDWKSGRSVTDNRDQALVYALYVRERHGVPDESILARVEHLALGLPAEEYSFTKEELDGCVDSIRDSIAAMKTYLIEESRNRPREKQEFPMREDTSFCSAFCEFYELDRTEIASLQEGPF